MRRRSWVPSEPGGRGHGGARRPSHRHRHLPVHRRRRFDPAPAGGPRTYAAALEEHRRALRTAFAAHGGHEVDTQGDSFFIAFPTATQAVAAAADAQRASPLPVRMGLHTGEATLAGGGYVGLAVHRAARIAAAAAGGQVLLSDATAAVIGDEPPAGTALRFLGEHRLKDFPRPAALSQLDVHGLATAFPPPRTLAPGRELSGPTGDLLGRDDDVAALTALLHAC